MKLWTIQSQVIVDGIEKNGIYHPVFPKSKYYYQMREVYDLLLKSFNAVNNTVYSGVIFGFAKVGENNPIENYAEFSELLRNSSDVISTLYFINKPDYKVLELRYDDTFNPLTIDYNDWQIIMPPHVIYTERIPEIYKCLANGKYHAPVKPRITQLHAPYIKSENIINTYENVSI